MTIITPFKIGDLVYAIDYMESSEVEKPLRKKFYTITSAVIYSMTYYISAKGEEHTVLLATNDGEQWGIDIPLDWINKDKQELIKKLITLL